MLSIIIPYRDREEHFEKFMKGINRINQAKEIIIVEQFDVRPFNRGKLLNIGAIYSKGTHLIFHDVDMLPTFKEYPIRHGVTQLARSTIQTVGYLGGVTEYDTKTFFDAGGYSNRFFSRAEDNEMMFNLNRQRIEIKNDFKPFQTQWHERPKNEFDPILWAKAQEPRLATDGVYHCKFTLVENITYSNVRILKVSI